MSNKDRKMFDYENLRKKREQIENLKVIGGSIWALCLLTLCLNTLLTPIITVPLCLAFIVVGSILNFIFSKKEKEIDELSNQRSLFEAQKAYFEDGSYSNLLSRLPRGRPCEIPVKDIKKTTNNVESTVSLTVKDIKTDHQQEASPRL